MPERIELESWTEYFELQCRGDTLYVEIHILCSIMLNISLAHHQVSVYFAFILSLFLSGNSFFLSYYAQYFAQRFNILLKVELYNQLLNSDITHIYLNCIYTSWTAIARLIMSYLYSCAVLVNVTFLTRPNALIVLLKYTDLFQSEQQNETKVWEGLPFLLPYYVTVFHFKHNYCN